MTKNHGRPAKPLELHLETLTYAEQMAWWAKEDPYRFEKSSYRIDGRAVLNERDIRFDDEGNLTHVSRPVATVCFGQIIPFVRFRNLRFGWNGRTKKQYESRCFRCKARPACKALVARRIAALPNGRQLFDDAMEQMAADPLANVFRSSSPRHFRAAIVTHGPFLDANAEEIRHARQLRVKEQRVADAARKARDRMRGYKAGQVDPAYVGAAIAERDRRLACLLAATQDTGAARTLSKLTPASCAFVADVWLRDWLERYVAREHRAVDVADWLIAHGRHQGQGRASLQGRVPKDRERVQLLEAGNPPRWRTFKPEEALAAGHTRKAADLFV